MKSEKQNIKAMLIVGIAACIVAGILVPIAIAMGVFGAIEEAPFNPMIVFMFLFSGIVLAMGVALLVFYSLKKGDSIEITDDCLKIISSKKIIEVKYDEIDTCSSNQNSLNVKRKGEERPIGIWFIKNGYELSKEINERMKK